MAQNSYKYVFASSTSELPSTGTTVNLGLGQVGIFDANTWQAVTAPQATTNHAIIIAQGTTSDTFVPGIAKSNETYKSLPITPFSIRKWEAIKAQPGKPQVYTMGFDGVDTNKTLNVPTGATNFTFWVTMSGQPIANLLGDTPESHYASYTEQFSVNLPCDTSCSDTCGATVDCNIIADAVISSFQTRKLIGGQLITDYIKISKLLSCETPSGIPTTGFTTYHLLVQDSGDNIALAQVQAQYTGVPVKRVSYTGITSTYEIILPSGSSAPSAFVENINPLIPNCTTCPSGYTLHNTVYLFTVKRKDSGTSADLNAIKGDYSDSAAIRLSYDGVTSVYEIHNTTGITPSAVPGDIVTSAGSLQSVCVANSAMTTPWTNVKSCTKGLKTFQLTIENTDCGGTYLTQLRAIYGAGVSLVDNNADTCTSLYEVTIPSDNVTCDTCDVQPYTWTAPVAFKGLKWVEVLGQTGYGTGCVCGIKFESVYEQRKAQECFLKQVPFEFEPLFITVSTRNPDPNDYSVLCYPDVPTTLVSPVAYPFGFGRVVADAVIASNFQFNQPWRLNPAERDSMSYSLGIDLQGYYDEYILEVGYQPSEAGSVSGFGKSQVEVFEWHFFYPQGQGAAFAQAINGYLASANVPIAPVNI
jgi:hypothetical protein